MIASSSRRRSVGVPRTGRRPPWARARTRRSSASRTRWSVSSAALRSAARNSSGLRSRARARSSSVFRIESGVRSSWLASSMNRRSVSTDVWIRSRRSFIVAPSRVISSSAGGRDRRPRRSADEMAAASLRMRSTGAKAAPASHHAASDSRSTAIGTPIPSVTASCNSWSARSWSEVPTITTARPVGVCTGTANSRLTLSMPGRSRSKNAGAEIDRITDVGSIAVPRTMSFERTISPVASATCANASSGSMSPEPTSTVAGPLLRASTTRIAARERRPASTVSSRSAAVRR